MAAARRTAPAQVSVTVRGEMPTTVVEYARSKIARVVDHTDQHVLQASVVLSLAADPAVARPARAEASLDLGERAVRASAAAGDALGAVDLLEDRLRENLLQHRLRQRTRHRTPANGGEGTWRHGDLPTVRPDYYPRPPSEREVLRRKTFAVQPMTPDEAAYEMDLLDHDFYLFVERSSGGDAVVSRGDGAYRLSTEAPVLTEQEAIERLVLSGEPFLLHTDPVSGRGRVLYLRYDGHYGLIVPSNG